MTREVLLKLSKLELQASAAKWRTINHESICDGMGCSPNGCPGHDTGVAYYLDGPVFLPDGEVPMTMLSNFDDSPQGTAKGEAEEMEAFRQADIDCRFIVLLRNHARELIDSAMEHEGTDAWFNGDKSENQLIWEI